MANNGADMREDLLVPQGAATGRPISPCSLGGNNASFGSHNSACSNPGSSSAISHMQQQQLLQEPQPQPHFSSPDIAPLFSNMQGEYETDFLPPSQNSENALHSDEQSYDQFEDLDFGFALGRTPYEAVQGTVTNFGSGNINYPLETPNLTPQMGAESSLNVEQPLSQNMLGAATESNASFPMSQWANNPNLQPQFDQSSNGLGSNPNLLPQSQLPTGQGNNPNLQQPSNEPRVTQEMVSPGLTGSNYRRFPFSGYQNQVPNIVMQNGILVMVPSLDEQVVPNSETPRHEYTSIYDRAYEEIGLPIDPILRAWYSMRNLNP